MKVIHITVRPHLPERLKGLNEIAHNLWISWNFDAIRLFMRLDYDAWLESRRNPVRMLGLVTQERLEEVAKDDSFVAALDEVLARFEHYLNSPGWYKGSRDGVVAYFSMEYALDVNLPIYSGGLGILAGDHLKTASDLNLPLVGIGLLYRQGYFQQYLNPDGFQQESYPENDWYNLPVSLCKDGEGKPHIVSATVGKMEVAARIWQVRVGRIPLYLLDTNMEENSPDVRAITDTLYGGDREMRIQQEILLGIGGIRALKVLGYESTVSHMNEGHSAFLALEKIRVLMKEKGLTFREAVEAAKPTNLFTTHTPVPAGNERFSLDLMEKYFKAAADDLNLSWSDFLALGREDPDDEEETFCLTVLALKLSAYSNGVSRLHGTISRGMWGRIWPGLSQNEVPIGHITNGVHPYTWIAHDMGDLLDRYLGPDFKNDPTDLEIWNKLDRVSDEELWRTHERRRERLVAFVREHLKKQFARSSMTDAEIAMADEMLTPSALTISFARRFAAYKRGNLLLNDSERLIRLLSDNERPVQLIFAGKSHPADLAGKEMIREIVHFSKDPQVKSRIVFLEDYDMNVARYLVTGSDVWMNTPRRPLEASGTSGMKAAMNGVLNVSVLDGWWAEGYQPDCGWAIGQGEEYSDPQLADEVEGKTLYNLLENQILPLFFDRGRDGLPREWIRRMKASMQKYGHDFSSHRMVMEYATEYYTPAIENRRKIIENDYRRPKALAAYLARIEEQWNEVSISLPDLEDDGLRKAGEHFTVTASVRLALLKPAEVEVELYWGYLSSVGEIIRPEKIKMQPTDEKGEVINYAAEFECRLTGRLGYSARVIPRHPDLVDPLRTGFVKWAEA